MFVSKSGTGKAVAIEYPVQFSNDFEHTIADQYKVALIVLDVVRSDKHNPYQKVASKVYSRLMSYAGKKVSQISSDDKVEINRWYLKAYEYNLL